jgi:hypothetical protein
MGKFDLKNMNIKLNDTFEKIRKYFVGSELIEDKSTINRKQRLNVAIIIIMVVVSFVGAFIFLGSQDIKKSSDVDEKDNHIEDMSKIGQTIELGTDGTKGGVKWQNFLEESIEQEGQKRQSQIDILKETIETSVQSQKEHQDKEFDELKSRLAFALNELDRLKSENQNIQNDIALISSKEGGGMVPAELGITSIYDDGGTRAPVSSYNHIPATSFVTGTLLGGISVSTSVNAASEPIPVVIQLRGRGNLPADFAVEISQCRLLASCYGDISSERAIIRAEELICEDKEAGLITSTKVAGVIYGDDGANGIRGTVVSMSDKHLKNAFVGGVLSGFANTAGGQSSFNINALGAVSTKQQGMKDMAKEGVIGGTSSAAEKLADYHIKLAENISPVILIPGGTRVDVMFTKSVQIGSFDIEDAINSERGKNHEK